MELFSLLPVASTTALTAITDQAGDVLTAVQGVLVAILAFGIIYSIVALIRTRK